MRRAVRAAETFSNARGVARLRDREAQHAHAVHLRRPGRVVVLPGEVVERAGRQHGELDLGRDQLRDAPRERLGAAVDLDAVALDDERDAHELVLEQRPSAYRIRRPDASGRSSARRRSAASARPAASPRDETSPRAAPPRRAARSSPSSTQARAAERLGHGARVSRDHRHPVRERLHQRRAEALVHRQRQVRVGAAVPGVARPGRDRAGERTRARRRSPATSCSSARPVRVSNRRVEPTSTSEASGARWRWKSANALITSSSRLLGASRPTESTIGVGDCGRRGGDARGQVEQQRHDGRRRRAPPRASSAALKLESAITTSNASRKRSRARPAAVAEVGHRRVVRAQQLAGRDVVVDEADAARARARVLDRAPDRVAEDDGGPSFSIRPALVEAHAPPVELRVHVLGHDLALVPPVGEQLAPSEAPGR